MTLDELQKQIQDACEACHKASDALLSTLDSNIKALDAAIATAHKMIDSTL